MPDTSGPSTADHVIVLGTFTLAPGDRDAFLSSKVAQVTDSRAEDGNLEYAFSADGNDAGRVLLTELWVSDETFQAHLARIAAEREADGAVDPDAVAILDRSFQVFHARPAP